MIREEFRKKLESRHTLLVVLWLRFICADFLYVWIADFILAHEPNAPRPAFSNMVRAGLWVLAVGDIWLLYGFWKKRFLTKEAVLTQPAKPQITASLRDHASPVEERAAAVISLYFTFKLSAFALAAAVAIYGFVLAFWGHYGTDQYVLSVVSLALLLYEFPSKAFLQELVREIEIRGDR